jgi:hypothetical protein
MYFQTAISARISKYVSGGLNRRNHYFPTSMATRFRSTPESIAKRIAQGRGQGVGPHYLPWQEVQDFPSRGVSHRVMGLKTQRVHHLFSESENKVFLIYDIVQPILDIREQFPLLPLEETLEIARKIGVKHPTDPATKYPVVMTTDFLLKVRLNRELLFHARTVKCLVDLDDPRTLEKFEIELRYYRRRDINWGYVIREDLPPALVENAALVHPFGRLSDLYPLTEKEVRTIGADLRRGIRRKKFTLIELVTEYDNKLLLASGTCFSVVCHLIARSIWRVDLLKAIQVNERLTLL